MKPSKLYGAQRNSRLLSRVKGPTAETRTTQRSHVLAARPIASLSLLLLLTACAPTKQPPAIDTVRQQSLSKPMAENKTNAAMISSWVLSGAMAAKNEKKAWTASIHWVQEGQANYQIRLFGPLGGGTVFIEKKGSVTRFEEGAKRVTSTNAEQLLQDQTGVRLPVNKLYYWVRGLPAPGAVQAKKYDESTHLRSFQQDGYTIEYATYALMGQIDLPSKMTLTGHGITVKLVVKKWKI